MHQPPLFDIAMPSVRAPEPTGRRSTPKTPDPDTIRWTAHNPKRRVPCDDCIRDLIGAGGGSSRPRRPVPARPAQHRHRPLHPAHAAAPRARRAARHEDQPEPHMSACGCPRPDRITDQTAHTAFHDLVLTQGGPAGRVDAASLRAARGHSTGTLPGETILDIRARTSGKRASGALREASR